MTARSWQLAAGIAAAAFCLSLLFGMLLPIYTDEVAWRLQTRAALDGWVDRGLSDICGANTTAAPPAFMLPLRYATAALNTYFSFPLFVRVSGLICAFVWVGMLGYLIRLISRDWREGTTLALLCFGLLGLGFLPLLMVMSRPEQPILLTSTIAIIVAAKAWFPEPKAHSPLAAGVRAALIVLLGAAALGFHLKGVVYMPLFLACALLSSRGAEGRAARVGAVLVLIVLTIIAARYWVHRFQCPGDAIIAKHLAQQNIAATLFGPGSLSGRLTSIAAGLDPLNYVRLIVPGDHPMSNWLPAEEVGRVQSVVWGLVIPFAWTLSLLIAAGCLIRPLAGAIRSLKVEAGVILPLLIAAVGSAWSVSQIVRNDYEAALALPMAVLFVLFSVRAANLSENVLRRLRSWSALVAVLALASQGTMLLIYAKPLWAVASKGGYAAGQPFSVSPYRYSRIRQEIVAAGRTCGIDVANRPRDLLIDDLTYFPYVDSWRPLHRLGVISVWNGEIKDPVAYLRARNSSGFIMNCGYLPAHLQARSRRSGTFCCMGKGDLAAGSSR